MSKDLILNSLYIKGFRGLREFKIESLGRVNLITGKNNTGKSSILEALALYASGFDLQLMSRLQAHRGAKYSRLVFGKPIAENGNILEANIDLISSLFTGHKVAFGSDPIVIGEDDNILSKSTLSVNTIHQSYKGKEIQGVDKTFIRKDHSIFKISHDEKDEISFSMEYEWLPKFANRSNTAYMFPMQYVEAISDEQIDRISQLWDEIALSGEEDTVIQALKFIDSDISKIAFVKEYGQDNRIAKVKLSNVSKPVPLASMGDGINRILSIVLAQVNADNGFLLVDEFENGLHYSVQDQLWEMVFQLAVDLNVQVFATTHSNDCVQSFERVLNSGKEGFGGKLIRLENHNGDIKEVPFSAEELKIASKHQIEVR